MNKPGHAMKVTIVTIDGVDYSPVSFVSGEDFTEAWSLLAGVYGSLWTEAHYDPLNESTKQFAMPLAEKMKRANEILRFKT
jgi:hypothetical protein